MQQHRRPRGADPAGGRPGEDAVGLPQRLYGSARSPSDLAQPAHLGMAGTPRRRRDRGHARARRACRTSCSTRQGTLSGGQQQRASVARALYNRPARSSSATSRCRRSTACRRRRFSASSCARHDTAILALHDIPLALAHADRVVVIEDGRIVLDAPLARSLPSTLSHITVGDPAGQTA